MTEGLRIGELAELAGVSARAVRHYHRSGVLPEPARRSNGYRVYGLVDVVRLLRLRRLVELGLSLSEAAAVDRDPASDDVGELLGTLVADLREQEDALRLRRERLERMLDGPSRSDPTRSPELSAVLDVLDATGPGAGREALVAELVEHVGADPAQALDAYRFALAAGPDPQDATMEAEFAALADRAPDDPAVRSLARRLAEHGEQIMAGWGGDPPAEGDPGAAARLERAVTADLAPAQARCVRLMTAMIRERTS